MMGLIGHFVSLFLSLILLGLALFAKKRIGYSFNPVSIFLFFWFSYIFFPLVLVWDLRIDLFSIIFIFIFNFLFFIPVFFYNWSGARVAKSHLKNHEIRECSFFILFFTSVLSLFSLIVDLNKQGLIGYGFFEIASLYSDRRYTGGLVSNIFAKFGNSLSLISAILGGLCLPYLVKKRVAILFFSFLPSVFMMLFQGAKGGFFLSLAFFVGAFFTERLLLKEYSINVIKIIGKYRVVVFCFLALGAVISSFLSRGGYGLDFDGQIKFIKYHMASYSSGHLFAFSEWFSDYFGIEKSGLNYAVSSEVYPGYYTFASIYNIFGIKFEMPLGIFDEFVDYPDILTTNIYTVFRGLIMDFSLVGALFFAFICGVLILYFYRSLLIRPNTFSALLLIYFFAFSYQTFGVSSFTWVTFPFSFLIMLCVYKIIFKKR